MDAAHKDQHWPWLGFALEEALRFLVVEASDVVIYATPEVLVAQLPREVTTQLLSTALDAGAMTPATILETAPPALLAEHLEPEVLWHCLADAGARAQLSAKGGAATDGGKRWLASILQRALDQQLLSPADLLRFVPPAEFVRDAPLAVVAEIIRTGLTRGAFNPDLVLVHLTPKVIAENLQPMLAWSCIVDAVTRKFELGPAEVIDTRVKDKKADATPLSTSVSPPGGGKKESGKKEPAGKIEPVVAGRRGAAPIKPVVEALDWSAGELGEDVVEVVDEPPSPPSLIRQA